MSSLIGRILGSPEALEEGVKAIARTGDALVFTPEEKAEHNAKVLSEARAYLVKWLEISQGQNLARRVIALGIAATWLVQYIVSMAMSTIAPWVTGMRMMMGEDGRLREVPLSFMLQQSADTIGGYAAGMTGAMMLILTFYFAAPHLGEVIGPAMQRFGKVFNGNKPGQPAQPVDETDDRHREVPDGVSDGGHRSGPPHRRHLP